MKRKATTWNYCYPDDPHPGLLHLEPPALSGAPSFWIQCGGGTSDDQDETARRVAALWNAAERAALPTEDIENGKIERALERIEKLEAEKAEMVVALKTMVEMVEMNGFGKHYALDLARAAIRREEK